MEKLGEVLLSIGAVSAGALNRALMMQRSAGGRLGTVLLEQGWVTEETLARALVKVTGRPYAHWDRVKSAAKEVASLLPAKVALRVFAVPFEREGRILRVAMRDPNDLAAQDEIAFVTGYKIESWSISEVRFFEALERLYGDRCAARYRVLADRLDRGIRPQAPPPVPPPPPDLRGQDRPAETSGVGLPPPPPTGRPADLWRAVPTGASEDIEIATWRPTPFVKPSPPAPAAPIELEIEEPHAESDHAAAAPPAPASFEPTPPPPPSAPPAASPPRPEPPPSPPSEAGPIEPPVEAVSGDTANAIPEPAAAREIPRPETLEAARERILEAETRDDIADAALSYLEPAFPLVALFIARKDDVIGWQVRGHDASRSGFKAIRISWKEPSIFLNVKLSGTPYQGRLPDLPSHEPVLEAVGTRPERCAVFPVMLRKRVVAFLFLEYAGPALPRQRADELKALSSAIAAGLAALIVQQRARP